MPTINRLETRLGFSLALASLSHAAARSWPGFIIARLGLGIGQSANFPASIKTVAEWFPQKVLPSVMVRHVKDDVGRNIEILAPGGGFVFNTVHNIQAEALPENIMTMWEALREFEKY